MSPTAQEAVNAAIRKTGYVVNPHARNLVTGASDSIGFLLTEPQERLFEDPNFNVLHARLPPRHWPRTTSRWC